MSDDVHTKLDEILRQAKATNGRVTALEYDMRDVKDVLYGDEDRKTSGLIAQSNEVAALLRQWDGLMKVGKLLAGALGSVAVALTINLLASGVG